MHNTREGMLSHLKRSPGASVEALAQRLDLAPMTIRQHLTKLAGEGLVRAETERRPTGRPAHVYFLTPAGEAWFPKAYDRLAALLLDELATLEPRDLAGVSAPDRRAALYEGIARRAAETHRTELERMHGRERLVAAVAILTAESGFTELEETSSGWNVREYNCVYRAVAEAHTDLCTFHTAYIGALVGAPVELDGCQCDGANACCFRIAP